MKIKSLHFFDVGPLGEQTINLNNDWDDNIESRVLLSGPNGCGKSTVLRAMAMLWDALGYWLDHNKALPQRHHSYEWLQRWEGCAVILQGVGNIGDDVGLIYGELSWCESLIAKHGEVAWIGEGSARTGKPGKPRKELFLPEKIWFKEWADSRKKMILTFDPVDVPNVIFLDAEERRWVAPRRGVGDHMAEMPSLRWLSRYIASDDWKGQLEASLINLKTTRLHKYHEVIRQLNQFLAGKEIESDIKSGENRLRVKVSGRRGQSHSLDDLSAGEHQVLILIYVLARWAENGAIVLIDEPDLYLHPSLVTGLLANLENLVGDLGGQLLITSHQPEIWHRYETSGKRIELRSVE